MSGSQFQQTPHFDAVYTLLPSALRAGIDDLLSTATHESAVKFTLDQLVRFSLGRDIADGDSCSREEWDLQKNKAERVLSSLQLEDHKRKKRSRDEGDPGSTELSTNSKRPKLETNTHNTNGELDEVPVFTLHSVAVSSPIRKKSNITIYRNDTIRFTHAISNTQEASIPLGSLTRAFLIPTPGKSKPHWTIIVLAGSDQGQIIFGLDAVSSSITTTVHPEPPRHHPQGTESKTVLTQFFSYLPPQIIFQEPSLNWFRSPGNYPYVGAYLRARDGHLFFLEDGLLFGEKKPCVWIGMEQIDNVRSLSVTGRTFSLFVTRVANIPQEEEREETEFSLIDGKNQEAVALWVKKNQHRFGAREEEAQKDMETMIRKDDPIRDDDTQEQEANEDSEDSDDADFESDSVSDGGSATSQSSEDEEEEENQCESDEEELSRSGEDERKKLSSSRHPLLRPGAMPRMSKAAIDAVVGMVEEDLTGAVQRKDEAEGEEDELDELEE